MVNRRILRIKAMQAIYSFYQSREALGHLCTDELKNFFSPDLNSMEKQDLPKLNRQKNESEKLFFHTLEKKENFVTKDEEVIDKVEEKIKSFHKRVKDLKKHYKTEMRKDVDTIRKAYQYFLYLSVALRNFEEKIQSEKSVKRQTVFDKIKSIDLIENYFVEEKIMTWPVDNEVLNKIIKKNVYTNESLLAELNSEGLHFKTLAKLYKSAIFKSEALETEMESYDLRWPENETIVKGLIVKTLKSSEPDELAIQEISPNWEEDKDFFEDLYDLALDNEEELSNLVVEKLKNWDIERVALIDKILLKLAICEMTNFQSIPVKVSINEYIDISKVYSTPKSKTFINGILDKISLELQEKGKIKKSGRGLLDNK